MLTESSSEIEIHLCLGEHKGGCRHFCSKVSLWFTHCHSKVLGKFDMNSSKETVNQLTDFYLLHQSKSSAT